MIRILLHFDLILNEVNLRREDRALGVVLQGVFAACAVLHLLFWCAGIRFDGLSFGSQIAMMRVAGCPPHGVPSWCARPSLLQTFAHLRELERGICSVLYGTRQNRLGMLYAVDVRSSASVAGW